MGIAVVRTDGIIREDKKMKKQPIRILHVIGIMDHGGAESMIMNLYRNIDREKLQFDFAENSLKPAYFDDEIRSLGGRVFHCAPYTGTNYFKYKKWWDVFFAEHAEEYPVVHGHNGNTAAIYLKSAKRSGRVTIAHSHNTNPEGLRGILQKIYSYRMRYIADYFFGCSTQAGIDRFGRKTVNGPRYHLMKNSVDTAAFRYDRVKATQMRERLGMNGDEFIVGHIGRFVEQKNHAYLLRVFAEIVKRCPEARLILVGDGPLKEKIISEARRLEVFDRTIFTGMRDDVPDLLQAMDVLAFPSLYEGLPVTLVEAQASGLACVISDAVPADSIICKDLVTVVGLKRSPSAWAEQILSRRSDRRSDHCSEVAAAGFDIAENAKWLEVFYLEKAKR